MACYFVSIRLKTNSDLFAPTIFADHFDAADSKTARDMAQRAYQKAQQVKFNDPALDKLVADMPPLSTCDIVARKSVKRKD